MLFFLTDVLYRMVPPLYESLESALAAAFPRARRRVRVPIVVQFGSWVGGDMDGNPHVTAKSIRADARAAALARARPVLPRMRGARGALEPGLEPRRRVRGARTAHARSTRGTSPKPRASLPARHRQMPYRAYLRLVGARLKATYDDRAFPYESPDEFVADLELIADSLRANKGRNAGLFAVRRLLRRVRTFGFYIATLDIRQNALVHRRVIGEALQERGWLDARRASSARAGSRRRSSGASRRSARCRRRAAARSPSSRRSRIAGASTAASRSALTS